MKSKDKIDVIVERIPKYGNKLWMRIKIKYSKDGKNDILVPSFEDWFRMIRGLMECERDKYKNSLDPMAIPREFFLACFDESLTWDDIKKEFKIPDRENNNSQNKKIPFDLYILIGVIINFVKHIF